MHRWLWGWTSLMAEQGGSEKCKARQRRTIKARQGKLLDCFRLLLQQYSSERESVAEGSMQTLIEQ